MITRIIDGLTVLQSQRLLDHGVSHGWFGVSLGDTMRRDTMTEEEATRVEQRWEQACRALSMNPRDLVNTTGLFQTDKVQLLTATAKGQTVGEADGYVTSAQKLPIVLRGADCMNILIYEPDAKVMSVVHAGGKGIASDILKNVAQTMINQGAELKKVIVAIGPAIAPQHFVPTMEIDHFTLDTIQSANPSKVQLTDGRVGYDIVRTACNKLEELGVSPNNIEVSGIDTVSSPDFYSWERDRIDNPTVSMYRNGLFVEIL